MTDTRAVPLADVLGVLTGRPIGNPMSLLTWMTGERPRSWGFAGTSRRCRSVLGDLHGDLAAAVPPRLADEPAMAAWVREMCERFGPTRDIARLDAVPEQRSAAA